MISVDMFSDMFMSNQMMATGSIYLFIFAKDWSKGGEDQIPFSGHVSFFFLHK